MASPSSAAIHKLETDGVLLAMDVSHLQKIPESSGGANSTVNCSEEPMAKDQVDKDTGLPNVQPPPLQLELNDVYAMRLAEYWYGGLGPYRHLYRMRAKKAYKNSETQWSIKFTVEPNPGGLYFRRFHYQKLVLSDSEQGYECIEWSEDPETPEEDDFDPDEYDEGDDLETLEEEEQLALDARESHEAEVHGLEADNELSLEELLAKYGMQSSTPLEDAVGGQSKRQGSDDDSVDDTSGGRTRRSKRRRVSAQAAPPSTTEVDPNTTNSSDNEQRTNDNGHNATGEVHVSTNNGNAAGTPKGTALAVPSVTKNCASNSAHTGDDHVFAAPAPVTSTPTTPPELAPRHLPPPTDVPPARAPGLGDDTNGHAQPHPHHYLEEDTPEKRDKRLRNYFDPSMYEEDTEIYTANADMKEIRIGEGFQASTEQIGNVGDVACSDPAQHCTLVHNPAVNAYLDHATLSLEATGKTIEAAHVYLQQCSHNVTLAEKDFNPSVVATAAPWTDVEVLQFEHCLFMHGKAFGAMLSHLPNRTMRDVIEYYYTWKRSERYDMFVAQYSGYHGVARHKDTVRPGHPVDAFAVALRRLSRGRCDSTASQDDAHSDTDSTMGGDENTMTSDGNLSARSDDNGIIATVAHT